MGEVVNARLSKELASKLDLLALRGYKSRSEALRFLVEKFFAEHPELILKGNLSELLSSPPKLRDEELEEMGKKLFTKPVAELVAEGRGR